MTDKEVSKLPAVAQGLPNNESHTLAVPAQHCFPKLMPARSTITVASPVWSVDGFAEHADMSV
jgi:hypothetical protein